MTGLRTLCDARGRLSRKEIDLKLITVLALAGATGCGPTAPVVNADAALDSGKIASDVSTPLDGGGRDATGGRDELVDRAPEDDDAAHGIVVLPAQFIEENVPLRMLGDGDPIELWPAPQGGHVVLVAAKVKHFVGDTAILRVQARYPDTPFVVAEEARSVKLVPAPGEPDTLQPDLATRTQVAHIPLCPDYDPVDIVDRPLEFTVRITPFGMEEPSGSATINLYPSCVAGVTDVPFCRCECSANYKLGKCPRDAGKSD
jgi:hypothetical protein